MIGDIVAAFTVGLLVAAVYYELTGCNNGHVWDDGTSRWEIVPVADKEQYVVQRTDVYRCQCEGCIGEKTKNGSHFRMKADDVDDAIEVMREHKYEP